MSERKTTEFKMRVAESDKTAWQIAAEEEGVALSEFARRAMNDRANQARVSDARGEDSSIAPTRICYDGYACLAPDCSCAVSTSTDEKSVAKSWMFEARNG